MRTVEVVPYNLNWPEKFKAESKRVADALGDNIVAIHHIGSTAIPRIYAKPIIDLLVEVKGIMRVDEQSSLMAYLGYEAMGEFGISGRRYFRKFNLQRIRTHHIHVFQVGSNQVARHLTFRDYMLAHPQKAQQYSDLKRKLAKEYPTDIDGYMDGKDGFIKEIDKSAAAWAAARLESQTPMP